MSKETPPANPQKNAMPMSYFGRKRCATRVNSRLSAEESTTPRKSFAVKTICANLHEPMCVSEDGGRCGETSMLSEA